MSSRVPEIRCPKLGHSLPIAYCYQMPEGRPCSRLFQCWEEVVPRLRAVVARLVPPEKWAEYFEAPPTPKAVSLVDLIRKAKGGSDHAT
jgi:hypothetical protein